MAMTYTTLTAGKSTAGSIANWVNYARLDIASILDEAQALIYQLLRVREMEAVRAFSVAAGQCSVALPSDFLDPNGPLRAPSHMLELDSTTKSIVESQRMYEEIAGGTFAADPFATAVNSRNVTATLLNHNLTGGSLITIANADPVGGLTLNGSFPIISLNSTSAFVFDAQAYATATVAAGGGLAPSYSASKLIEGFPSVWAIYDERIQFDVAFEETMRFRLPCYVQPPLLSASNATNFLTNRYPNVLRKACMAAAADFNEDTEEYNKQKADMIGLISTIAAQDDLRFRGSDIMTDTP